MSPIKWTAPVLVRVHPCTLITGQPNNPSPGPERCCRHAVLVLYPHLAWVFKPHCPCDAALQIIRWPCLSFCGADRVWHCFSTELVWLSCEERPNSSRIQRRALSVARFYWDGSILLAIERHLFLTLILLICRLSPKVSCFLGDNKAAASFSPSCHVCSARLTQQIHSCSSVWDIKECENKLMRWWTMRRWGGH